MAESSIEWTDATWNPVTGCTRVSAGCDNCYAVQMTNRLEAMGQTAKYGGLTVLNGKGDRHFNGQIRTHDDALAIPLRKHSPTTWFVNSMSDLFHRDVPDEFILKVWDVMRRCFNERPGHIFQILTKRPERMADFVPRIRFDHKGDGRVWLASDPTKHEGGYSLGAGQLGCTGLTNVWLGTSVENQDAADKRIPHLLKCPAAVRFLSCEPLLGPVDLANVRHADGEHVTDALRGETHYLPTTCIDDTSGGIDWVIVGGESGPGARPFYVNWADSIIEQCRAASVACFVKQLGANVRCIDDEVGDVVISLKSKKGGDMNEWPADLRIREMPTAHLAATA